MLLKKETHLNLQQPAKKILRFSTAFSNTFVFVRVDKTGEQESIVHVNSDGKTIFRHTYHDIINTFGMASDRQVIVLDVPNNRIDIIDLQKQRIYHILHQYLFDDVAQMDVYTFFQTKYFCVVQHGSHSDHRLRLSYYNYRDIGQLIVQGLIKEYSNDQKNQEAAEVAFISEFGTDGEWTYDCPIKRANNHSMIVWFKVKHQDEISFFQWDLRDIPEGKLNHIKVKNTVGMLYGLNNIQIELVTLWETRPDIYTLVCNSNKAILNAVNFDGVVNNVYILDKKASTIRQSKFYFKDAGTKFSWNDQMIDYIYMGPVSVFHTFSYEKGNALPSPVYYVNNESEEVIEQEVWNCTCYIEFFVPGFDNSSIIEAQYPNADVKKVKVTYKKLMDPREVSLHFLLHINEDFDDDLLKDAIDLMHQPA